VRSFRRPLKVPTNTHRAVTRLVQEMNLHQIGWLDMADRTGLSPSGLQQWPTRNVPTVDNLEAALNVLGLCLVVGRLANQRDPRDLDESPSAENDTDCAV
jgi:transcriptional regulator with XRE-family HTH domain